MIFQEVSSIAGFRGILRIKKTSGHLYVMRGGSKNKRVVRTYLIYGVELGRLCKETGCIYIPNPIKGQYHESVHVLNYRL